MMTHSARFGLGLTILLSTASNQWAAGSGTISLQAVRKNGVNITPTNIVTGAVPGDVFDCEFMISGWGNEPTQVRGYQFRLLGEAAHAGSPAPGGVLPVGWDAPIQTMPCSIPSHCTNPAYPICQVGKCVGSNHHPENGAFITITDPDFILFEFTPGQGGLGVFSGLAITSLNYLYGATAQESAGAEDTGVAKYAGTLKLEVKPGACGTYVYTMDTNQQNTFLLDPTPQTVTYPLKVVPLTFDFGSCPLEIQSTSPPVCVIDARYPHDPASTTPRLGFNTLQMTFNLDPGVLTCSNFTLSAVPTGPGTVSCSNVTCNSALKQCTMTFNNAIQTSKWTCVQLNPNMDKACIGSLPADVDSSRTSEAPDVVKLMDHLDRPLQVPLDPWECDIDRSTRCAPPDIIAAIDLLNGAGLFNPFRAVSLPTCPTTGIPIP